MDATTTMIIPYKSSFGPVEVEVYVISYGNRVRAVKTDNREITMFSGSSRLWTELQRRGWVR